MAFLSACGRLDLALEGTPAVGLAASGRAAGLDKPGLWLAAADGDARGLVLQISGPEAELAMEDILPAFDAFLGGDAPRP